MAARDFGRHCAASLGSDILHEPPPEQSHGTRAGQCFGAGGARAEAAGGFGTVYHVALPALRAGRLLARGHEHAARLHAFFALLDAVDDTNLLHRGGKAGLRFVQGAARRFLERGSVECEDWLPEAVSIHRECVARWLSPGGSADLLAAALFIDALEEVLAFAE